MTKKSRRKSAGAQPERPAHSEPPASAAGRGPLTGLDRSITLISFVLLLLLVLIVTPLMSQRKSQDLSAFAAHFLQALEHSDATALQAQFSERLQKQIPLQEVSNWLTTKGLRPVTQLQQTLLRQEENRAVLRARFETPEGSGLLTASLLSVPQLSFKSHWQVDNLCRSDREAPRKIQAILAWIQTQKFAQAYAATADGAIKVERYSQAAFSEHVRQLGLTRSGTWDWQPLTSEGELWVLKGRLGKQTYRFEILENPSTCAYLLLDVQRQGSI